MLRQHKTAKTRGLGKRARSKEPFDAATAKPDAHEAPKVTAWLVFSRTEKASAARLFKDSGFNIALNDNGKPVPYTVAADSPAEVEYYRCKDPECSVLPVSELRIVIAMGGKPTNQDKWAEWGYNPAKNKIKQGPQQHAA